MGQSTVVGCTLLYYTSKYTSYNVSLYDSCNKVLKLDLEEMLFWSWRIDLRTCKSWNWSPGGNVIWS